MMSDLKPLMHLPVWGWLVLFLVGCATTPTAQPEQPNAAAEPSEEEFNPFDGPKTWDSLIDHYEFDCPVTNLVLDTPHPIQLAGKAFTIYGSEMRVAPGSWGKTLRLGVLAGIEDPSGRTIANLRYAAKRFQKAKVDFVLVNGDIGGNRDDIHEILKSLVALFPFPILFHSGNTEPTSVLNRLFSMMQKEHPRLINLNWVRHVNLGNIHLLSLPGHHERATLYAGGCHYQEKDLEAVSLLAQQIAAEGQVAILSAHSVPKSKGRKAIDYTFDMGNNGDPQITNLIAESPIPFGIFSHVVEAGGRASSDLYSGEQIKKKEQQNARQLYVNVGAATSTPILLHSRSSSRGMAAIFTVEGREASVDFLKLRPIWKHGKRPRKLKKKKKKKRRKSKGSWKGLD
mgnify:CR=1 FL=1